MSKRPYTMEDNSSENLSIVVCVLYNSGLFEVGLGANFNWRVGD